MTDHSFIRFENTLEKAFNLNESPEVQNHFHGQIQLKPFDPQPYWQATLTSFNFDIDNANYRVYVVDNCSKEETEVTDNVRIQTFVENNITQAKIRFAHFNKDFGNSLVYFKIDRYGNGSKFFYSNPLLITANNIELTSRLDYTEKTRDLRTSANKPFTYSIRLQFWYSNHVPKTEKDIYYQVTTEQNVNTRILENNYSEWKTSQWNAWTFKRLEKAFYNGAFWINQVRNYITEIEYQNREGFTNISEHTFLTDPNEYDYLNIIMVIIDPDLIETDFLASSSLLASTETLVSTEHIYLEP